MPLRSTTATSRSSAHRKPPFANTAFEQFGARNESLFATGELVDVCFDAGEEGVDFGSQGGEEGGLGGVEGGFGEEFEVLGFVSGLE